MELSVVVDVVARKDWSCKYKGVWDYDTLYGVGRMSRELCKYRSLDFMIPCMRYCSPCPIYVYALLMFEDAMSRSWHLGNVVSLVRMINDAVDYQQPSHSKHRYEIVYMQKKESLALCLLSSLPLYHQLIQPKAKASNAIVTMLKPFGGQVGSCASLGYQHHRPLRNQWTS